MSGHGHPLVHREMWRPLLRTRYVLLLLTVIVIACIVATVGVAIVRATTRDTTREKLTRAHEPRRDLSDSTPTTFSTAVPGER